VTHLVWDWNGTLLNDLDVVVAATNASLAAFGTGPVTAEEHRRDFRRPVEAYYADVIGRTLTVEEFAVIDGVFHKTYVAASETCALAVDALDCLKLWPGTQSLLSMWFHEQLVPTVERYEISGFFLRVDGLRDAVSGSHKAPMLAAHLDALGLAGPEAVLIGDSIDDAVAAASVGARCVLYAGGFTHASRLAEVGVPVATTLTEALAIARAGDPA